jgi:hypothetical protein
MASARDRPLVKATRSPSGVRSIRKAPPESTSARRYGRPSTSRYGRSRSCRDARSTHHRAARDRCRRTKTGDRPFPCSYRTWQGHRAEQGVGWLPGRQRARTLGPLSIGAPSRRPITLRNSRIARNYSGSSPSSGRRCRKARKSRPS